MRVGSERDAEIIVPPPHYQLETRPLDGWRPLEVLSGGYIPQGELVFVDAIDLSLGSM